MFRRVRRAPQAIVQPHTAWRRAGAVLACLAGLAATPARALTVQLFQDGFADGATLSGQLSGEDADGDGYLVAVELSSFALHWSGNRAVAAFDQGMDERASLYLHLGTMRLEHLATLTQTGDGERLFSYDSYGWPGYDIPGRVLDERAQTLSLSWQPMTLTAAVPEPQALWLLAAGLGQLGWLMRRRR